MGKFTISMAVFNSYVKLPEGRFVSPKKKHIFAEWPFMNGNHVHPKVGPEWKPPAGRRRSTISIGLARICVVFGLEMFSNSHIMSTMYFSMCKSWLFFAMSDSLLCNSLRRRRPASWRSAAPFWKGLRLNSQGSAAADARRNPKSTGVRWSGNPQVSTDIWRFGRNHQVDISI